MRAFLLVLFSVELAVLAVAYREVCHGAASVALVRQFRYDFAVRALWAPGKHGIGACVEPGFRGLFFRHAEEQFENHSENSASGDKKLPSLRSNQILP
jgi:hypothetical protein